MSAEHGHLADIRLDRQRLAAAVVDVQSLRTLNPTEYDSEKVMVTERDAHGVSEVTLMPTSEDIHYAPLPISKVFKDLGFTGNDDPVSLKFHMHGDGEGFDVTYSRIGEEIVGVTLSTAPEKGSVNGNSGKVLPFFPNPGDHVEKMTEREAVLAAGYKNIVKGENPHRTSILVSTVSWAKNFLRSSNAPQK